MLRRIPEKIILDDLSSPTLITVGPNGEICIEGYGCIPPGNVTNCYLQCPQNCVPQVTQVTVVIPQSCECPYEWCVTITGKPCLWSYEVQQTFGSRKVYCFQDPSGGTPTAAQVAAGIAANINADPFAVVTATAVGAVITLTEKDCNSTCGFEAFTDSGAVVSVTPHQDGILTSIQLAKLFPIQWGHAGARPSLAYCGPYCAFCFTIKENCAVQDIDQANAYNCYEREVCFYINQNAANFQTVIDTLLAAFTCGCCSQFSASFTSTLVGSTSTTAATVSSAQVSACPVPGNLTYVWSVLGGGSITAGQGTAAATASNLVDGQSVIMLVVTIPNCGTITQCVKVNSSLTQPQTSANGPCA